MAVSKRKKPVYSIKWSERVIQYALTMPRRGFFPIERNICIPNIEWAISGLGHECDLLVIRKSNWAIEVEIKISVADLKADAKKDHDHRSKLIRDLYFAMPKEVYEKGAEFIPERAGIIVVGYDEANHFFWFSEKRKPQKNKDARKLTEDEIFRGLRTSLYRFWNMVQTDVERRNIIGAEQISMIAGE